VLAFIGSALSGLHRGVTLLSHINSVFFLLLALFIVGFGPFRSAMAISWEGLREFASHFVARALFLDFNSDDPWPRQWTVFYWSVWLAWAPITSAFLGRIAVGYTVRAFILVNLVLPAAFSLMWMAIFGGSALALQAGGADLISLVNAKGPEALLYAVFAQFPFASIVIPAFLFTAFISYVTAADSNTIAMAGMSQHGISPESPDPATWVKLVWGGTVGALSLCLLCLSGLDGIRTLSYLGGFPALFFELTVTFGLFKLCWRPEKFGLRIPKWELSAESGLPEASPQASPP
jgi:choline-glycine betaine transporter